MSLECAKFEPNVVKMVIFSKILQNLPRGWGRNQSAYFKKMSYDVLFTFKDQKYSDLEK